MNTDDLKFLWLRVSRMVKSYFNLNSIQKGDIYESCGFHPVIATEVDYVNDNIMGISLIDGSYGHSCSLYYCGVVKMSLEEALERKEYWEFKDDPNHPYWKRLNDTWGCE